MQNDIDFVVGFPDKDGNSFHAPSMGDQNEMKMNESSFLHANTYMCILDIHNSSKRQKQTSKMRSPIMRHVNPYQPQCRYKAKKVLKF